MGVQSWIPAQWRLSERDGFVGGGLGEGHPLLDLPGEPDLPQEGDEAGQAAKRGNGRGGFVQDQFGFAKEGANLDLGRFARGRAGLFKHQSLCPQPFAQGDPFFTSEFGFILNSEVER